MKRSKKIVVSICAIFIIVSIGLYFTVAGVLGGEMLNYKGDQKFIWVNPTVDSSKKTVFIVGDNEGTEMFDLLAPYYLFNVTGQANVFIVSEKKQQILLVNSLFILPHFTFSEIDSLNIKADILVIPNITMSLKSPQKINTVNWVKKQYTGENIILSICNGAATMAATGLFDGKPITTHASDFKTLKKQFPGPRWVKDIMVTESGNLYSTAGVANAVEGSLVVIKRTFGEETLQKVLLDVKYPHTNVQLEHNSNKVTTGSIVTAVSSFLFKKRNHMGVLLQDDINEFQLGSLLDVYSRTFPRSLKSFTNDNKPVKSKFGLTILPSGNVNDDQVDEIHVLDASAFNETDEKKFPETRVINYHFADKKYPINIYLENIKKSYGGKFTNFVKLTLDYN